MLVTLISRRRLSNHRYTVIIALIFIGSGVFGQNYNISLSTRVTEVIGTAGFFRGETSQTMRPISAANIYAIRIGKVKNDDISWHRLFGSPEIGFGLEYLNIHNDSEIGDPFSAYLFMEAGLINTRNFRLTLATDFGASMNWLPFHKDTNTQNIALGSRLNYHVGLGFRSYYNVTKKWSFLLAATLNHHSNGAVTKPNLGINMASVELGVKYALTSNQTRKEWLHTPRKLKPYSLLSFYSGVRNLEINDDYYGFYGLHVNRMWPINRKFAFGVGAEILFDNGAFVDKNDVSLSERYSNAFYGSGALVINRISLALDIGHYLWRDEGDRLPESQIYQRLGVSYRIYNDLFIGLKVRAFELRKADLLEFHVGWQL